MGSLIRMSLSDSLPHPTLRPKDTHEYRALQHALQRKRKTKFDSLRHKRFVWWIYIIIQLCFTKCWGSERHWPSLELHQPEALSHSNVTAATKIVACVAGVKRRGGRGGGGEYPLRFIRLLRRQQKLQQRELKQLPSRNGWIAACEFVRRRDYTREREHCVTSQKFKIVPRETTVFM